LRCLGFSGQSNSLFFKEKDGQSDGQPQVKSHAPGSGANTTGWAFSSVRSAAPRWRSPWSQPFQRITPCCTFLVAYRFAKVAAFAEEGNDEVTAASKYLGY